MDNSENPNFIITIRAAGERTEKLCYDTVVKQAKGAEIVIIRQNPFKKALEECYRRGLNSSKKWLITVDADMILLPGSIELLLREAEKMPSHYLQLQGKIIDKITGNIRKAGPRIYRTSLLPSLLSASESFKDHIRPESRLITAHGEKGHPSRYIPVVTCLHDFEQYYKDIYRKAYVHAKKHSEFLPKMIKTSAEKQNEDLDYKVILKALWDGLSDVSSVLTADTRLFGEKSSSAIKAIGLKEKNSPNVSEFEEDSHITDKSLTPLVANQREFLNYSDQPKQSVVSMHKIRESLKKRGGLRSLKLATGLLFIKAGKKLYN